MKAGGGGAFQLADRIKHPKLLEIACAATQLMIQGTFELRDPADYDLKDPAESCRN